MLGCILYSLVFNHHPFQDASVLAISNAIFDVDLKIANRMPKLMDLIFWTLFPDPSSRPSAEDLLEVLQRYDKLDFIPLPLVRHLITCLSKIQILGSGILENRSYGQSDPRSVNCKLLNQQN